MTIRSRRHRSGVLALPVLLTSVALAGCGGFDSAASGEHLIHDYVNKFGRGKVTVKSVSCPGGVSRKVGGSYDCRVVLRDTTTGTDHPGTITIHMAAGNRVELNGATDIHLR